MSSVEAGLSLTNSSAKSYPGRAVAAYAPSALGREMFHTYATHHLGTLSASDISTLLETHLWKEGAGLMIALPDWSGHLSIESADGTSFLLCVERFNTRRRFGLFPFVERRCLKLRDLSIADLRDKLEGIVG